MQRRPLSETGPGEALAIARELWRRSIVTMRRTPGLLLLSLLIGAALWVFVTDTENPTRVDVFPASIPVTAVNVGPALAVANTLPSIQVRISAPEDRWERLTSNHLRAFVDLNGLEAREQLVEVSVDVDGISGVRVVETIPASVVVNLEDFVGKQVPAVARLFGTVPLGYEVAQTRVGQPTVEVSGPESLVALVREAVADVNVTGLAVTLEQTISLTARGEGGGEIRGVRLDPPSLTVSVDVAQTSLTRTLPLEAVIEGEPALGYRVSGVQVVPATASVRGAIEVIQGLESLKLQPISIAGATEGQLSQIATLLPPPGVRVSGPVSVSVVVDVSPVLGSLRLSVAPEAVGVGPGLVARFGDAAVTVVLEGPLLALNAIAPASVRVIVDVAGEQAGTVELTVEVEAPAGASVVTVQPQTLSVTLEIAP